MVVPEHLFMPIKKIQDTILICPPVVSQWAAVGAMTAGRQYCADKLKMTTEIREEVLEELKSIAEIVTVPRADGAFYLLLRVHTNMDSMELTRRLIEEHRVAVIPGGTFGIEDGCYLRIAYGALHKDTAAEAMHRLVGGLNSILRS